MTTILGDGQFETLRGPLSSLKFNSTSHLTMNMFLWLTGI